MISQSANELDGPRRFCCAAQCIHRTCARVFVAFVVCSAPLPAQEIVELDRFARCDCRLELRQLIALGDASSPGAIDSEAAQLMYNSASRQFAVLTDLRVAVFAHDGAFVRSIGRQGRGPGELQGLTTGIFASDRLILMDGGSHKWIVLDTAGRLLHEEPLAVRPGPFLHLSADTLVVGTFDRRPGAAGFPLHMVSYRSPQPIRHFGSPSRESIPATAYAVTLARNPGTRSIWVAYPHALRFELWSEDGQLSQVLRGEPEWFPVVRDWRNPGQPPRTRLASFTVDSSDRLWVLTLTADARWREALGSTGTTEGAIIRDVSRYYDTRLDVFDLRRKQYVGTHTWDNAYARVLERDGTMLGYFVDSNDTTVRMIVQEIAVRYSREQDSGDQGFGLRGGG